MSCFGEPDCHVSRFETFIHNLDIQKDDFTVKVRIIRLWSQPLFKDPEQLYSIEMILMDEEGSKIHANVLQKWIPKFIPRMSLTPTDKRIPFKFQRRQFPVSLCFVMTINKSQGQSLSKVGLFLRQRVVAHGQLYVALAETRGKFRRDGESQQLTVDDEGIISNRTKNVVYKEVFGNQKNMFIKSVRLWVDIRRKTDEKQSGIVVHPSKSHR
ncbi:hypothetical protein OSB04_015131 [Centaurea solstitialis]|uniref:Replication protein A 70 kDa DNA-binding subunit B/D first OB fold domain-containing protein n=1 Tax=Centaurea solstitialis TaxID=347529 RepID=A0AA38TBT5_9ASTR|nr:hypothetical protein OSB04_015131 [Centaurea solstitialis]